MVSGTTNDDGTVTATSIRLGDILTQGATPPAGGSGTDTTQSTTN